MLAALANRFGVCLWAEGTRSLFIFSSDSAKCMLKMARAYKTECVRRNGPLGDKSSDDRPEGIKLSMHSRLSECVVLSTVFVMSALCAGSFESDTGDVQSIPHWRSTFTDYICFDCQVHDAHDVGKCLSHLQALGADQPDVLGYDHAP